jgi:hypothetical protein
VTSGQTVGMLVVYVAGFGIGLLLTARLRPSGTLYLAN